MELTPATWRKASRSNESGDACVEVAGVAEVVAVRDSKDPGGPKLILSRSEFRRFADRLKSI
ncbi:DUF397 domain-containing protein [Actinomadura litoris]|uniref:DUF397 domain-containing protein n=1 Tax=Actinomadura litoris TaxID=2678616 RepID=UPI001FA6F4A3|nr:DUF397 domain-containing protein [Actinomadura litoris]